MPAPELGRLPSFLAASAAVVAVLVVTPTAVDSAEKKGGCSFPDSWRGRWFHLGFPDPLQITSDGISGKGQCVQQKKNKNMFLVKESDSYETCYRCMMIYEKHFNVLQYKESYCEESIDTMESLCNTIAGDAPLYTMFRKGGDLVKCPFRGPFSFSYSKGGRGQVCDYPLSYLDSCSDHKKMKLKYQACLDVGGSEVATEEMSCLATWKEGSSRYLVSLMNHSHVYTDESRYRCFVYRRKRHQQQQGEGNIIYQMAQSSQTSCLGLWNVEEGYKTFTLTKLSKDKSICSFPHWLNYHHDWRSIDDRSSLHVNRKAHSIKFREEGDDEETEAHITCHEATEVDSTKVRVIAHIKSKCDSGYVCMMFQKKDDHVMRLQIGAKSHHPSEACMRYHFDERSTPSRTMVSGARNTRPCPFSGRYSLTGSHSALTGLLDAPANADEEDCYGVSFFMQAGCSESSDLHVESTCHPRPLAATDRERGVQSDAPINVRSEFTCHGEWAAAAEGGGTKQTLLLSSVPVLPAKRSGGTNSLSRHFMCLEFFDTDGIMSATTVNGACGDDGGTSGEKSALLFPAAATGGNEYVADLFNITSSGPCLQALKGGAVAPAPHLGPLLLTTVLFLIASFKTMSAA